MSISDAYIAGIFDGEGHVSAQLNKPGGWVSTCSIGQKNPEVLYLIQEYLGYGYVFCRSKKSYYCWKVSRRDDTLDFIRRIYPHSVVKKRRLKLAYQLTMLVGVQGRTGMKPEDAKRREQLGRKIRRLNRNVSDR